MKRRPVAQRVRRRFSTSPGGRGNEVLYDDGKTDAGDLFSTLRGDGLPTVGY